MLAVVGARLDAAVIEGVARGRLMAYAVDLPVRDDRVRPFLQGRRGLGLVTVDSADVAQVRTALLDALAATAALAAGVSRSSGRAYAGDVLLTNPIRSGSGENPPIVAATTVCRVSHESGVGR